MNRKLLIFKTLCLISFYDAFALGATDIAITNKERDHRVSYLNESNTLLLTSQNDRHKAQRAEIKKELHFPK